MTTTKQGENAAAKPWIEIRRQPQPGYFISYASIYWRPLRVFVLGRWLIGRP